MQVKFWLPCTPVQRDLEIHLSKSSNTGIADSSKIKKRMLPIGTIGLLRRTFIICTICTYLSKNNFKQNYIAEVVESKVAR